MALEISRSYSDAGTSAYAMMYAQQIVDHFTKALEENGCLVQFPAALYVEFNDYENQLRDYIAAAIDSEDYGTNSNYIDKSKANISYTKDYSSLTDEVIRSAVRSVSNNCFNCKIEKPKFDFTGLFGSLMSDIENSLSQFENMFKYNKTSVCQYAHFLSYLCVPDLLKLIALIMAALVRLMQNINLPRITVAIFIQGILTAIIQVLVKNIAILARFALTPVLCILDALETIYNSLPTPENLRAAAGKDIERLGLDKYVQGNSGIKGNLKTIRDSYTSRIRNTEKSVSEYVKNQMAPLENTINNAVQSLQNSVDELTGLLNHFQCEPGRSGVSVSQFLSNVSELMALANLLRYIIRFKSGKAAIDKVCNAHSDGTNYGNDNITEASDTKLDISNIGSIIAGVIGSDIDIIVDDKREPIAVVIKDNTNNDQSDNLSFWSCNIKDFTESINVPNIIKEIIEQDIPTLDIDKPEDWSLDNWNVTIIESGSPNDPREWDYIPYEIIPIGVEAEWNIPKHVKEIIETIDIYNPTVDGNIINDVEFVPKDVLDELTKRSVFKNPTSSVVIQELNRVDNTFGITKDTISQNTPVNNPDLIRKDVIGRTIHTDVISSGIGNMANLNLECLTPEDMISKIGDI